MKPTIPDLAGDLARAIIADPTLDAEKKQLGTDAVLALLEELYPEGEGDENAGEAKAALERMLAGEDQVATEESANDFLALKLGEGHARLAEARAEIRRTVASGKAVDKLLDDGKKAGEPSGLVAELLRD